MGVLAQGGKGSTRWRGLWLAATLALAAALPAAAREFQVDGRPAWVEPVPVPVAVPPSGI